MNEIPAKDMALKTILLRSDLTRETVKL